MERARAASARANARGAQVEQWVSRDHVAEWSAWEAWLKTIADGVSAFPTVEVRALPHALRLDFSPFLSCFGPSSQREDSFKRCKASSMGVLGAGVH